MLPGAFPGMPQMPPAGFPFPHFPGFGSLPVPTRKIEDTIFDRPPEICEPNETLYINNLNDRVKERDLKDYLQRRFGKCSLVVMSSLKRRGQAWIIYDEVETASRAMDELQGQLAFGKKMRISFSRNLSDKTRQRRGLDRREKLKTCVSDLAKPEETPPMTDPTTEVFFQASVSAPKTSSSRYNPPNRILFVENLSDDTTVSRLSLLFEKFDGFLEARVIPNRGVAFIEFNDEYLSQAPLGKLQNFEIEPGRFLSISNAKK